MALLAGCLWTGSAAAPTATPAAPLTPAEATARLGQTVTVRFVVACTERLLGQETLLLSPVCAYQSPYFRVVVPPAVLADLERQVGPVPERGLVGLTIEVRGVMRIQGGWYELVVERADDLRLARRRR